MNSNNLIVKKSSIRSTKKKLLSRPRQIRSRWQALELQCPYWTTMSPFYHPQMLNGSGKPLKPVSRDSNSRFNHRRLRNRIITIRAASWINFRMRTVLSKWALQPISNNKFLLSRQDLHLQTIRASFLTSMVIKLISTIPTLSGLEKSLSRKKCNSNRWKISDGTFNLQITIKRHLLSS